MNDTTPKRPRVLYIARAFPPTVGGMENLAYQLTQHLPRYVELETIINRRGKRALPGFLPYAFASALRRVRRGDIDAVLLADALLAPVGAALRRATNVPVAASICGLDVTWPNRAYQTVVPRALRGLDLALPISAATRAALHARTGSSPQSTVVPLGVNALPEPRPHDMEAFRRIVGGNESTRMVLTVGRLVERKGARWFVANVMQSLPPEVIYVCVGEGPERGAIVQAASDAGVSGRLRMAGRVPDGVLAAAYACADLFVMPNVPVAGDMEGFGLVALEASAHGLPVVASRIEGITEAVQHDRNGVLVPTLDAAAHAREIKRLLELPRERLRALGTDYAHFTTETYGWDATARRYAAELERMIDSARGFRGRMAENMSAAA